MFKTILLLTLSLGINLHQAQAQLSALEQLQLDISKLSELKGTLQDMYSNYQILAQEYGSLKNVAQGNFQLHLSYLNGLLEVSSVVGSDSHLGDISSTQAQILQLYQGAYAQFSTSPYLSASDKASLNALYEGILTQSAEDLDELNLVLTDGALSMTDDERLTVINQLDQRMQARLTTVKALNAKLGQILVQKGRHASDISNLQKLYGYE
jgi:hypothetical protein